MNKIIHGDTIEEMKKMTENSVDAIITDPPYGLGFMNKEWDSPAKHRELIERERQRAIQRKKEGKSPTDAPFTSSVQPGLPIKGAKEGRWFQEWFTQISKECLRVLKPGGYFLSFGGTRTYHRMTSGIEDAGFEIRDTIMWLYGSGFPKSLNIGLDFDKQECKRQLIKKLGRKPTKEEWNKEWKNFRKVVGQVPYTSPKADNSVQARSYGISGGLGDYAGKRIQQNVTEPKTKEAKDWEGWGTALKPACEPIVVARKPLSEKNVALNVLKHGTGGMNIDECRIGFEKDDSIIAKNPHTRTKGTDAYDTHCYGKYNPKEDFIDYTKSQGRFPANIILDEESAKMLDERSGESKSSKVGFDNVGWKHSGNTKEEMTKLRYQQEFKDKGGASRFFYCAKASRSERNFGLDDFEEKNTKITNFYDLPREDGTIREQTTKKNNHPTVKPIKLMEYLIKLVTRENAIVLDPFIGSGTTAIACLKLNRQYIGIEKEEEYVKIANARIKPFLEQSKLN